MAEWGCERKDNLAPTGRNFFDQWFRKFAIEGQYSHGINVYLTKFVEKLGYSPMTSSFGHSFQIGAAYSPTNSRLEEFPVYASVSVIILIFVSMIIFRRYLCESQRSCPKHHCSLEYAFHKMHFP